MKKIKTNKDGIFFSAVLFAVLVTCAILAAKASQAITNLTEIIKGGLF